MSMLIKYVKAKNFLQNWRRKNQIKKSRIEEFELKRSYMLKIKILKAWRHKDDYTVQVWKKQRVFKNWKIACRESIQERNKTEDAFRFRKRLLKQKVMYILYKFTQ